MPPLFANLSPGEEKSLKGLCSGVFILKSKSFYRKNQLIPCKAYRQSINHQIFHHVIPVINPDTFINHHVTIDAKK